MTGHDNAGDFGRQVACCIEQRDAVHLGHHQVREQHIEGLRAQHDERGARRWCAGGRVTLDGKRVAQGLQMCGLVIDDENRCLYRVGHAVNSSTTGRRYTSAGALRG